MITFCLSFSLKVAASINIIKTLQGVRCSVIEHGMMSLSFQTAVQKNETKLITEQSTTSCVLTDLEHSHIQSDVIACTVL